MVRSAAVVRRSFTQRFSSSSQKRCTATVYNNWLLRSQAGGGRHRQAAAECGMPNLQALHARVQDVRAAPFDVVTSRALGPLDELVALTSPLLAPGGCWAAMKGKRPDDELRAVPAEFVQLPASVPYAIAQSPIATSELIARLDKALQKPKPAPNQKRIEGYALALAWRDEPEARAAVARTVASVDGSLKACVEHYAKQNGWVPA